MIKHKLPPLYKYLDITGAIPTLERQKFKWTKPSDFKARFKDDMDMTISRLFPENEEERLTLMRDNIIPILINKIDQRTTYTDPYLDLIQSAFRNNPGSADIVHNELLKESISDIYDTQRIRRVSEEIVNEINLHLQGYRVFCTSDDILSKQMWKDYAEDSSGIVLRIEPSPHLYKDSVFTLFKPVQYFVERLPLFESTLDFLENSLFEDQRKLISKTIDRVIYSKTKNYDYESEWRCILPLLPHEEHLGDVYQEFHSEEITGLYLGKNIKISDRKKIIQLSQQINPYIEIYQMIEMTDGNISTNTITGTRAWKN